MCVCVRVCVCVCICASVVSVYLYLSLSLCCVISGCGFQNLYCMLPEVSARNLILQFHTFEKLMINTDSHHKRHNGENLIHSK